MSHSITVPLTSGYHIDVERLLASRMLIQANSGGGKSHLIRNICEQTHGKVQQIIFDDEGEFATLREKYPYVLIGADGDLAADMRTAKKLVQKIMEMEISVIVGLSEMTPSHRKEYVAAFLDALMLLPRSLWKDCLIIIDEAHKYAPEKGKGDSIALEPVALTASAGRKRGYCVILATQRLAKLNKDVTAECLNKLIGRTSFEDLTRAGEELAFDKKGSRELRKLEPGDFWGYGPAISPDPVKVRTARVNKTHPPKRGSLRAPAPLPQREIKARLAELADLPREVAEEAATVDSLRKEIASLKHELRSAEVIPLPRDRSKEVAAKIKDSVSSQLADIGVKAEARISSAIAALQGISDLLPVHINWPKLDAEALPRLNQNVAYGIDKGTKGGDRTIISAVERKNDGSMLVKAAGEFGGPEQRIVNAVAQLQDMGVYPAPKNVLAFFSGYTVSGHFNNTLGKMKKLGLISYPAPSTVALTLYGSSIISDRRLIRTESELHDLWLSKLPGPESKILRRLLQAYPSSIPVNVLAEETGYTVSGHFNNTLGHLRKLGLITKRSPVAATDVLFPTTYQ